MSVHRCSRLLAGHGSAHVQLQACPHKENALNSLEINLEDLGRYVVMLFLQETLLGVDRSNRAGQHVNCLEGDHLCRKAHLDHPQRIKIPFCSCPLERAVESNGMVRRQAFTDAKDIRASWLAIF